FVFFFFQAEDGIRDKLVTGVQTCALPISMSSTAPVMAPPLVEVRDLVKHYPLRAGLFRRVVEEVHAVCGVSFDVARGETLGLVRSEERRVGKECRAGWSPRHQKKIDMVGR